MGLHTFTYALYPHAGTVTEGGTHSGGILNLSDAGHPAESREEKVQTAGKRIV